MKNERRLTKRIDFWLTNELWFWIKMKSNSTGESDATILRNLLKKAINDESPVVDANWKNNKER
jgi:hypothetical protein